MDQPISKVCTKCGIDKPLAEYHRHKDGLYGYRPQCRTCRNAYSKAWRQANPERVKATKKRVKARGLGQWRAEADWKRRPEVAEHLKAANRERTARLARRTDAELLADWNRLRPDGIKCCNMCGAWRTREDFAIARHQADGRVSRCRPCLRVYKLRGEKIRGDLETYWEANGMTPHTCTYCGVNLNYLGSNPDAPPMHIDHIHPVALGGTNDVDNLAPACPSCNCSKGARTLAEWLTTAA